MRRSCIWGSGRDDRIDRTTRARQAFRRLPQIQVLLSHLSTLLLYLPQLECGERRRRKLKPGSISIALEGHGTDDGFAGLCGRGLVVILAPGSPKVTLRVRMW